ncbi:MAG: hypothetical protein KU29_00060 [Sulfurovum sp. FS06-10]|nr:MAG: hypothetical protein KU29_00060 [Sulfurovum sp. FS06-10]
MLKKSILFLILIFVQFGFSQVTERKVLRGRVVSDSIGVERLTVSNITSNIDAITDVQGRFSIKAKATDTLFFESTSFISQKYILTEKDFWLPELEIILYVKMNELDEVIITPYTLTGDLKRDTKRIQVYGEGFTKIDTKTIKYYEDDVRKGTPANTAMPTVLAPTGVNLFGIVAGIVNLIGIEGNPKKNSERVFEERRMRDIQAKSFSDHMLERFSHHFFIETLKIKNEDIPTFMGFAELNVYELSPLLKTENELKLIEYLINKSVAFKLQNPTK